MPGPLCTWPRLSLSDELEGLVTYDGHLAYAAILHGAEVVEPTV